MIMICDEIIIDIFYVNVYAIYAMKKGYGVWLNEMEMVWQG